MICLAHYAKDVLPIVRQNCFKIFITIIIPDNFFESIVQTYSIKDGGALQLKGRQYCDQLEFGIIEFDTRSQKYKILTTITKYFMILVSATSRVRRIMLLTKIIFSVVRNTTNSRHFWRRCLTRQLKEHHTT